MKKQNTRKFTALAAAAVLAACAVAPSVGFLPVSAAATANTITINKADGSNDTASHTYTVYQIFSGTVVVDDATSTSSLTNVQWASDSGSSFLTALKAADTTYLDSNETKNLKDAFADCDSAASVAAVLANYANDSAFVKAFAKFAASQTDNLKTVNVTSTETKDGDNVTSTALTGDLLSDGYYLIVDSTSSFSNTASTQGANSDYMLIQLDASEGVDITLKSSLPTVEKKVKENAKTVTYEETGDTETYVGSQYNDVADYSIGDTVPFELIGTMPSTYDSYTTYQYTFNDTLGKEFTYVGNIVVKVVDGNNTYYVKAETSETADDGYVLTAPDSSSTLPTTDQTITVKFDDLKKVTLYTDSDFSTKSSETLSKDSVIYVNYDTTLNSNAVVGLSGQLNAVNLTYSNNPNGEGTGTTPDDKVVVFTYETDLTKVDSSNTELTLEGAEFTLTKTVDDTTYYAKFTSNGTVFDSWVAESSVPTKDGNIDLTEYTLEGQAVSDSDETKALYKIKGLDDGTYTLTETKAPSGYEKSVGSTFTLKVEATTVNNQKWDDFDASKALTALKLTTTPDGGTGVESNADENATENKYGVVTATITNSSSSTLPSTGGIGTTIFYVAGGVLVVGAGVLLITKKRAKDAQ